MEMSAKRVSNAERQKSVSIMMAPKRKKGECERQKGNKHEGSRTYVKGAEGKLNLSTGMRVKHLTLNGLPRACYQKGKTG